MTGLIVTTSYFQGPLPSLKQLRSLYQKASTQKQAAENLVHQLAGAGSDAPATIVCYKGVAHMLIAKYSSNPVKKYKKFLDGKAMITRSVSRDTLNIEARLLRFTIQYHTPRFLGYNAELEADKLFLTASLPQIKDPELKVMVEKMLSISKADQR
ncbi:MAG: hypothetical protein ABIN80_23160 [Dyadobacter sp.]|uniref:hypothetical protein n=1 Tax=Dyadobacter sp. TaxID=1914288 RepID=UPI003264901D